ncbi:LegC family aminotransferase [Dehalococcoidia bacterium]|nr:LegC family aminotransferase [Dehalococcoidia bacterium]
MRRDAKAHRQGPTIALSVPEINGKEWEYVKECLDTGWVSSAGDFVDRFENAVATFVGAKHAIAVTNGTSALHTALLLAGIGPDEEVLVPSLTFIAPANAIRYVGAWPVFIDVDQETWQIDPQRIAEFVDKECQWQNGRLRNLATGRTVRAILPIHLLGHPADMTPLLQLAHKYELKVIEDAAESIGAQYRGQAVGRLGHIGCFSFNGNKIITCGGGGMIVTDNPAIADQARYLTTQARDDHTEGIHNTIGYNYRLTNIQAAMGCAQMEMLPRYVETKRNIAKVYHEAFLHIPGVLPMPEASWAFSTFWLYTILIDESRFGIDSRGLTQALRERNIETRALWQPLHLSPAFSDAQRRACPVAEHLSSQAISLPSSVGLGQDQQHVIDSVIHIANLTTP